MDPSTYCNKPTGAIERFEEWLKSFDMESKKGEISELLVSQVEVRGLYTRLVSIINIKVSDIFMVSQVEF